MVPENLKPGYPIEVRMDTQWIPAEIVVGGKSHGLSFRRTRLCLPLCVGVEWPQRTSRQNNITQHGPCLGGKGELYKARLATDQSIIDVTVDDIMKRWRGNEGTAEVSLGDGEGLPLAQPSQISACKHRIDPLGIDSVNPGAPGGGGCE